MKTNVFSNFRTVKLSVGFVGHRNRRTKATLQITETKNGKNLIRIRMNHSGKEIGDTSQNILY
jgi:hypothetical protein